MTEQPEPFWVTADITKTSRTLYRKVQDGAIWIYERWTPIYDSDGIERQPAMISVTSVFVPDPVPVVINNLTVTEESNGRQYSRRAV